MPRRPTSTPRRPTSIDVDATSADGGRGAERGSGCRNGGRVREVPDSTSVDRGLAARSQIWDTSQKMPERELQLGKKRLKEML
jgi:hypothetical protein